MNYLAHVYLSFGDEERMIGNLSADFIKGNQGIAELPIGIQKGIQLHRHIDTFTDSHEVVKESKRRLYTLYSKYASIIVDIYYDHLLAINWSNYSNESLEDFAQKTYQTLEKHYDKLPPKLQRRLPSMMEHNWLTGYQEMKGIATTFHFFAKRVKTTIDISKAHEQLEKDLKLYNDEFNRYFPKLIRFSQQTIIEIEESFIPRNGKKW